MDHKDIHNRLFTNYTLHDAEKAFGISVRKLSYLIRNNLIKPIVENGSLLVNENEIEKYLKLPKNIQTKHHIGYIKTLGPGLITGASDDDPSGIGTYSSVGATYGLSLNWLSLYLLPMMTAVQETVARIGIVTNKGLSKVIGNRYGKKVLYPLVVLLVIANTINIGADIGAMAASLQLLFPINFYLTAILLTLIIIFLEVTIPYHKYSKFLKWLTVSLFAYIITGFIINPDWEDVVKSIAIPYVSFDSAFLAAMVAVMGTTITPYLFFWQASEEIEEEKEKNIFQDHRKIAIKNEIKEMRKDTYVGMTLANIVFMFIVITTAFVLFKNGINNIDSAEDAAIALKPLAGNFAYLLFTVGIIGVGFLAVPVLAGSSAYAISELFKWKEGFSGTFKKEKGFYGVIIVSLLFGLAFNFLGINPIKSLLYAAVINGIIAPILMVFIFKIGRDDKIMGEFTNPFWVNIWGTLATILMGGSAVAMVYFFFIKSN